MSSRVYRKLSGSALTLGIANPLRTDRYLGEVSPSPPQTSLDISSGSRRFALLNVCWSVVCSGLCFYRIIRRKKLHFHASSPKRLWWRRKPFRAGTNPTSMCGKSSSVHCQHAVHRSYLAPISKELKTVPRHLIWKQDRKRSP